MGWEKELRGKRSSDEEHDVGVAAVCKSRLEERDDVVCLESAEAAAERREGDGDKSSVIFPEAVDTADDRVESGFDVLYAGRVPPVSLCREKQDVTSVGSVVDEKLPDSKRSVTAPCCIILHDSGVAEAELFGESCAHCTDGIDGIGDGGGEGDIENIGVMNNSKHIRPPWLITVYRKYDTYEGCVSLTPVIIPSMNFTF